MGFKTFLKAVFHPGQARRDERRVEKMAAEVGGPSKLQQIFEAQAGQGKDALKAAIDLAKTELANKRWQDMMAPRITRSDRQWTAKRRLENALAAAQSPEQAQKAEDDFTLAMRRAKRTPHKPGSGSPIPAAKARTVVHHNVVEHSDGVRFERKVGTKAAPISQKKVDQTQIDWKPRAAHRDPAPAVRAGENLRIIYDRTHFEGQRIDQVHLLLNLDLPTQGRPDGALVFKSRVMPFRKTPLQGADKAPASLRTFDFPLQDEQVGQQVSYGFKLTLADGTVAFDRNVDDAQGRPTYYRAQVEAREAV